MAGHVPAKPGSDPPKVRGPISRWLQRRERRSLCTTYPRFVQETFFIPNRAAHPGFFQEAVDPDIDSRHQLPRILYASYLECKYPLYDVCSACSTYIHISIEMCELIYICTRTRTHAPLPYESAWRCDDPYRFVTSVAMSFGFQGETLCC